MPKKHVDKDNSAMAYLQMMRRFMRVSSEWSHAAAELLGVSAADLIAGTYLADRGPMTAGRLAKAMGITTGAMTIAIDRLVRAGFAVRESHPGDRRKVIIKPVKLPLKLLSLRESIANQLQAIFSGYTEPELLKMIGITQRIIGVFEKEIFQLKRI
jgi:DNA-binding MarR family transcriptional regulator